MAESKSLVSRRNVMLGLVGTAAVAGTVGTVTTTDSSSADAFARLLEPVGLGKRGVSLASATVDDWRAQVGSYFTAHTGHVLKLADVQLFPESDRPKGMREDAFVARFDVAKGGEMPGSVIYRMSHPEGGTFDMFATSNPLKQLRMLAVFG